MICSVWCMIRFRLYVDVHNAGLATGMPVKMSLCCNNEPSCISKVCPVISLFCFCFLWVELQPRIFASKSGVLCVSIVSGREHERGTRWMRVGARQRARWDGALLRSLSVTPLLKAVRTECDASGIDLFRPPPSRHPPPPMASTHHMPELDASLSIMSYCLADHHYILYACKS